MEFDIDSTNFPIKLVKLNDCLSIPSLNAENLSYSNFFENYCHLNLPCIIKNVSNTWQSTQLWISNKKINLDYLNSHYGDCESLVYKCNEKYFNSQKSETWQLSRYINYWKNRTSLDNQPVYYLKDCHLKRQNINDNFYEVPIYFASDWLNEYCTTTGCDDYQFVYMGPKGSWTPFHSDVFGSYSWSVNLYGTKKWILFPPGEEQYLTDRSNDIPYDISDINHTRKCFEILQNANDAIFVPSGWYHQVWNLDDTISINHNWINGCNVDIILNELVENLKKVKFTISDCSDMENFNEHCQILLNAHFGMNYEKFFELLACIGRNRLGMLVDRTKRKLYNNHTIRIKHVRFDLKKITNVLEKMLIICENCRKEFIDNIKCLVNEIKQQEEINQ